MKRGREAAGPRMGGGAALWFAQKVTRSLPAVGLEREATLSLAFLCWK